MDRLLVLFSMFVLSISGCATMANVEGKEYLFIAPTGVRKPQIYGGVIRYVEWTKQLIDNHHDNDVPYHASDIVLGLPYYAFWAVDMPASAVADTLTIPVVVLMRPHWNKAEVPTLEDDVGDAQLEHKR